MIQNPKVHTSKNATCKGFKEEIKFNSRILVIIAKHATK
jgi:hypothetical protein